MTDFAAHTLGRILYATAGLHLHECHPTAGGGCRLVTFGGHYAGTIASDGSAELRDVRCGLPGVPVELAVVDGRDVLRPRE